MAESKLKRVETGGEAVLYRGDPRLAESDMDKWIRGQLEFDPKEVRARPHLYGSDAGFCARRNVLLEKNEWLDDDVNAAGTAYMLFGVALENQLAEALRRSGSLIVQGIRNVELPELPIRGKFDLVIFDSEEKLALVEVKSCGELPPEPKPTHLAQIQTYAAISGIERCWLTYMSRNLIPKKPIQTRTFRVDTSREALLHRLTIAAISRLASNRNHLPPVPAHFRKHTECHYCQFRDYFCFKTRPGLGSIEAISPLTEMTPGELIELESEAKTLAEELYADREYRRWKTLVSLVETPNVKDEHLERLNVLVEEQLRSLAEATY